jgi:O-antigen/teichoic acid export membrane protein
VTLTASPAKTLDVGALGRTAWPSRNRRVGRWRRWSASHPAWPITALLAGFPVWWALGVADLMFIFLAIPMALRMHVWHAKGRRLRMPPGFTLWLMFLVVMLAGLAALSLKAPGTAVSPLSNRLLAYSVKAATYLGVTVLLLFAGNLTERECSRRRLAWLLGLVGIYAVVGGLGGVVYPSLQFTSPLAYVLPQSATHNTLIQSWIHPGLAQIQSVLGSASGRPKAPFDYTNAWGDCVTILLPWLLVAWWAPRRKRWMALSIVAVAVVPILYSLDRGVWIGLTVSVCYLAIRLAARGRLALLGTVCAGIAAVGLLIVATPNNIIHQRLQHQNSNTIRATLDQLSVKDALASPLIGYGGTRHMQGSPQSIAVGPSPTCITCGQLEVGSTGQLWLLFVSNGFLGAGLYYAFFGFGIWRFRRDKTLYGTAGVLVLLLQFVYLIAYQSISAPLAFTMIAYAVLWRNDRWLRGDSAAKDSAERPGHPAAAPAARRFRASGFRYDGGHAARRTGSVIDTARYQRTIDTTRHQPVTGIAQPPPDIDVTQPLPAIGFAQSWSDTDLTQPLPVISTARRQRVDGRLAEVARGGLFNLIGAGVAGLCMVAVTLMVTRNFSQAAAGAFFATTSLFLIVEAVSSLGAVPGTVYFIARLRSIGQHHRIPEVLRAAIWPVAAASVAAAVALALAAPPLARLLIHGQFGHAGAGTREVAAALRALAVALPFAALLDTLLGATRGFRAMGPTNAVDRMGRSLLQLAGIAMVAAAGSAALLAPLWALPYVPAACAAWLWLRHIRRSQSVRGEPGQAGARQQEEPLRFWRFTAPRGLAALAQITIQRIDIVLVAIIRGPVEAAIYTAATRFLVVGQFGIQAIGMASQPRFTEMFTQRDFLGANRVYQATTAWLILLTWPAYLLAISFGPQILTLFGHSYLAGATVIVVLALAMLLLTGCGLVDMVLVTTGRSTWSLYNGLLAVAINVALDVLLIPRYGITGAAVAWAAAIVVSNLMPLAQLAATVRLHPFGRGSVIAIALCSLSFGVLPVAARELAGRGVVPSAAAIACGCAVMAAGMWRFRAELSLAALPGAMQLMAAVGRRRVKRRAANPSSTNSIK